ncbi:MAG: hypothetical protein R3C16_05770 [Hyphomonadaceae bacterium]
MAYQALVGLGIAVSEQLDLDIGYRYFVAPDAEYDGTSTPSKATTPTKL